MLGVHVLYLLVILWSGSQPGAKAKLPQKIDLDQQSFALSADVSISRSNKVSDHYTTEEFHSAWQLRSRVNFKIEGPLSNRLSERGTIYSAERQLFLIDRAISASCKRVEVEVVDQALNVDFVRLQETRHHIGTTRLLLFIQENSNKFQPIVMKNRTFEQDIVSRSRYEAHLDGGLTISVLYEESSALSLALGVPSRVLVTKDNEFSMLLKFMRIVLLKENEFIYSGSSSPGLRHAHLTAGGTDGGGSSDLLFDVLAVERAIGCSSDSATKKDFLGQLADSVRYRFSFRARLESDTLTGPYELAVGYEPELQTLRVDRSAKNRYSHTLASYRHDRVYHTYQRRGSSQFDYFFDSILRVTQHDELDNDSTCVVMKAGIGKRLTGTCENPFSLGEMLLGATEVTYLGLARVRGIEAYAFEATGSRMPVWLENPSVYRSEASEEFSLRRSDLKGVGSSPGSRTYTTVFYFARPESNRSTMIRDNRLLFMEIFKQARGGYLIASYTITLFDFTWQISAVAPNGQRTEDFYSLGDECLAAATEDNHYARINLQLKGTSGSNKNDNQTTTSQTNQWLRSPVVRNLAIMRAFYEQLSVPPTLAYDVESRYSTGGGREMVESMAVTMLAAERPEAPVDLIYLGNAYLKPEMVEMPISLTAFNFETCYLLAAHSRKNTLLAWNEFTTKCYMFHRAQDDSGPPEAVYDMNQRGPMEVYRVVPNAHRKLIHDDYMIKLDDLHEQLMSTGRLLLADPTSEVNGHRLDQDEERKQAYFGIDKLEVLHLNERTAYDLAEGGKHLGDINKFPGLGLVASDVEVNKVVEPKPQVAPSDATGGPQQVTPAGATMTFEQCQQACLIDLECRSFSTCIIEGKLQCVLSTIDFRASTLVLQLMFLQDEKSKLGSISSVNLEQAPDLAGTPGPSAKVHVRKHPTCELHNKLYTDLFRDGGSYDVNLQDRLLSPVTHPEQCAQKCYEITLESLREELTRLNARKEKPEDWAHFYAHTHCSGYFYLAHDKVGLKQLEITPEQLDSKNTGGATRGYCLFERGQSQFQMAHPPAGTKKLKNLKSQVVELRQFNLDFSVLYEKTHGVSLVETTKSLEEAGAYVQVAYMRKFEPNYLDVLTAFMERGGNTGSTLVTQQPATCARVCFTQLTPLWPACRSFEYVEVTDRTSARKNAFCAFNTATLWEARTVPGRSQLVRVKSEDQERVRGFANDQIQVWHYEPRNVLVAASLTEAFQVSLGEARQLSSNAVHSASDLHVSSLGVFCLICITLIAGLVVGARIGFGSSFSFNELLRSARRFGSSSTGGRSRGDRQTLVESATHIKIDDIVRSPEPPELEVPRENGHPTRDRA